MCEWKPMVYGAGVMLFILTVLGSGYWSYSIYQQHRTLWGWAERTQGWVNETHPKVVGLGKTLQKMAGNANIKSMLLQQNRLDKVEARLDKLESQLQTEAENSKPEGKGR